MINLFQFFKDNLLIFKNIFYLNENKIKFIFFSENKNYLKYSYLLIEYLSKKYPGEVCYVSSERDDVINKLDVKNLFVGKGFFLHYFFKTIKATNFFMTTTDLDNSLLKKNKYVQNYIYYFHGSVSTYKIYNEKAFDNYDTILCNGDYQFNEIRFRENFKNLKKKNLIKTGFFYFDYLYNKKKQLTDIICDEILVAPSWNKNKANFINEDIEKIIYKLIQLNFKVRFRPHPEIIKRSPKLMSYFKKIFNSENFIYDSNFENFDAMNKAKCLITDNSGISIEFVTIFKKPVIYYENFDKIHNPNFKKYEKLETMENIVKDKFGYKFKKHDIKNIDKIIQHSLSNFEQTEIDEFFLENFYNFKSTINFFDNNIDKICL